MATSESGNPERTTFVPEMVHSLRYITIDDKGEDRMKIEVNGEVCILTIGVPNTVEQRFFDTYKDCFVQDRMSRGILDPVDTRIKYDGYATYVEGLIKEKKNDRGNRKGKARASAGKQD